MTIIEFPGAAGRSDELSGRADGGGDEEGRGEDGGDGGNRDVLEAAEVESHFMSP
jgi:hypothetical protein